MALDNPDALNEATKWAFGSASGVTGFVLFGRWLLQQFGKGRLEIAQTSAQAEALKHQHDEIERQKGVIEDLLLRIEELEKHKRKLEDENRQLEAYKAIARSSALSAIAIIDAMCVCDDQRRARIQSILHAIAEYSEPVRKEVDSAF